MQSFHILQGVLAFFIMLSMSAFFSLSFTLLDHSSTLFRDYIVYPSIMIGLGVINLITNAGINTYVLPKLKQDAVPDIQVLDELEIYMICTCLYFTIFFQMNHLCILIIVYLTTLSLSTTTIYILVMIIISLIFMGFLFYIIYKLISIDEVYLKELHDKLYISNPNDIVSIEYIPYNDIVIRDSASSLSSSDNDENMCLVCTESNLDVVKLILKCGHTICETCHDRWIQLCINKSTTDVEVKCTLCDSNLEVLGRIDSSINKHYINPSKIKVLDV